MGYKELGVSFSMPGLRGKPELAYPGATVHVWRTPLSKPQNVPERKVVRGQGYFLSKKEIPKKSEQKLNELMSFIQRYMVLLGGEKKERKKEKRQSR